MPRQRKNYTRNKNRKNNKQTFKRSKSTNKKNAVLDKRKKNFRFIQRNKEAEDFQRRQKVVEEKYKQQFSTPVADTYEDIDDQSEEENALESLISTFKDQDKKIRYIESSSDDENSDEEDVDEENSAEDFEEEVDNNSEPELDLEEDDSENEHSAESEFSEDDESQLLQGSSAEQLSITQIDSDAEDTEIEDEVETDEDNRNSHQQNNVDKFTKSFNFELSPQHVENLLAKPTVVNQFELKWPNLGLLRIEISKSGKAPAGETDQVKKKRKLLADEENYASEGSPPEVVSPGDENLEHFDIKQQIVKNVPIANREYAMKRNSLTPLQSELLSIMTNYQDLSYPHRTLKNAEEIRFVYCLHAVNHILKTRAKVIHHNAKLKAAAEKNSGILITPDQYRDQGLVRPKILIILPFRESAFRVMNLIIDLMFGEGAEQAKTNGTVINYKRFMEEYTGATLHFPVTNPKPEDFEQTFAGNTDDNFRIGLSFTKKCIKLYTEFYSSDIILASTLGLRVIIGASGDEERDYDFLSSIEVLILDQAEMFMAQNWDHLLHVLDHMHLQPQSVRKTDFSRVRHWCLNGLSRFYRQTILSTSHELPEFRSLFSTKCCNYRGKVRVSNPIVNGSIQNVIISIPQVFHKVEVDSLEASFEQRFKYFINEILPQYKSPSMAHCMVFISSYFDYVRLRNYFKAETMNFVQICEYTKDAKIARARDMFFHSGAHFLLYSERAHFFRRTRIKGIRHLVFYQPPCWPHLYPELVNLMQDSYQNSRDGLESSMSVTVLYTKYDMIQVSAIIGTDRAGKLLRSNKKTHLFTTE